MKFSIFSSAVALSFAFAAPAQAAVTILPGGTGATFDNSGGSNTLYLSFDGQGGTPKALTPGLGALMALTLDTIIGNAFNFSYTLQNTSTLAGARVSGFGFDVAPNVTGASAAGLFDFTQLGANFASIEAEVCIWGGNGTCPQSNPANALPLGQTGNGTFVLNFANPQSLITLSNGLTRYQGFSGPNVNGETVTSAIGQPQLRITPFDVPPGAVPEPSTWALMLVGFATIGAAMRRRSSPHVAARLSLR